MLPSRNRASVRTGCRLSRTTSARAFTHSREPPNSSCSLDRSSTWRSADSGMSVY